MALTSKPSPARSPTERGGDETLLRVEVGCAGAPGDQEADEIGMPGGGRALRGSGPVGERCDEVGAVPGEQPDPFGHAVGDSPGQLPAHQLLGGVQSRAETGSPRAAVAGAEAELEEQLQVIVARLEHPVVERLAGVRVGARVEQQPGAGEHGVRADGGVVAGVGQVEQRLAAERAARPGGRPRVGGQPAGRAGKVNWRRSGAAARRWPRRPGRVATRTDC
jgi:hypothetical protein